MKFVVSLIQLAISAIWDGFVLMVLWNWFVPATFGGAPSLNLAQAIGLCLIIEAALLGLTINTHDANADSWSRILLRAYLGVVLMAIGLVLLIFI